MATKLFPNLQRISIKEHAKSNNYEDYIGVVLDKKNNNFKVVEGQFTDKKDMYRKMKARGLILRKAYERKVWEWIEANADGVIISYLMLSTAFSKWRSNNVLHKYYEKLLNDIPELNREREKGNPNTRGGDFITTDDKDAPKRQDESTELEEDFEDESHVVKLLGVTDETEEEIPYSSKVKLPEIKRNKLFPANAQVLDYILSLLSGDEPDFDNVRVILETPSGETREILYDLPTVQQHILKYQNMKNAKQLPQSGEYGIKLSGIHQQTEPVISEHTNRNGEFELKSPTWYNVNGKFQNPMIVDIVDEILNTNNSANTTGSTTKDKYNKIKVYVDGKLEKTYDKKSIGSDVKEIGTNRASWDKTTASNVVSQLKPKIKEIKDKLKDPNLSEKDKENLNNQLSFYNMQIQQNAAEVGNDIHSIGGWQGKALSQIGNDTPESREAIANNEELLDFVTNLVVDPEEKENFDEYIKHLIWNDEESLVNNKKFNRMNTSFSLNNPFYEFDDDELATILDDLRSGRPVSENKEERKAILHNLYWYVLADGVSTKSRNKQHADEMSGVNRANRLSDLITRKDSIGTGGFNHKTQSGRADADVEIGDLGKIQKEIDRLSKEPIYTPPSLRGETTPKNITGIMELRMASLNRKIKELDKLSKDSSLSEEERNELISNKKDLESKLAELEKQYKDEVNADLTKVYSSDGKTVKTLDPKETINNSSYKTDKYELPKKESVKVTQYDNDGATALHNAIPYQGKGFNYSAGPMKMTGQIVEDTTKTELNPSLFENDLLIPEVRDALYKIAMTFKDYLDLPFEVKDVYFTGSNANYNYTEDSDIDLHLVYDFEQAGVNAELLSKYLVAAKKDFNNKYDIKVKGIPVELGCENIAEPLVSTGVYSLGANTWVIKPNNAGIEIPDVDMNAFNDLSTQIDDTIKNQNASAIENLWKSIRSLRKDSLENEGEFGVGNMLFKKLRNSNYLEKLRNSMYDVQSKDLSLESSNKLQEEQLKDKKDYSEYLKDLQNELDSEETQDLLMNKSLLSYLDGYKDRNEKREVKEDNGVLNEGDIPNWKLNKALKYMDNQIPAEISNYKLVDSDGISLCRFIYNQKEDVIYKIPVRREEVLNGSYQFVSKPDEAKAINFEDFYNIVNSDENQRILWKTSLYDDLEQIAQEVQKYKDTKASNFKQWYDDNNESLDLDHILPKDKKLRNRILWQMYKDSTTGAVSNTNLRKKYSDKYDTSDADQEVEEATGDKLTVAHDMNDINKIFTALGLDPRYVTRPIYDHIKQRNPKNFSWDDVERQWKIVSMDDVRGYLEDGKFDLDKMPYKNIHVYMKDVNSMGSRPQAFNMVELSNLIKSSEQENDINNNSPKIAYDIYKQLPNTSNKFRQQVRQTYTERMLTPDQVRKALEYVQSDEFVRKAALSVEELKEKISKLNPENEGDKELIGLYQSELNRKQRILDFSYAGNGNLVDLYDGMKSMKQNGFKVILGALNSVEDGVTIIPRYSVQDNHGFAFYIKLPTEGFTYEDIKGHGSYDHRDIINDIKKYNGSY